MAPAIARLVWTIAIVASLAWLFTTVYSDGIPTDCSDLTGEQLTFCLDVNYS